MYVVQLLRATRHDPPALAGRDLERARRYAAGLEQFEELLDASGSIGTAARPITLFYALEQAGCSIAAAHSERNVGRLKRTHGLSFRIDAADWERAIVNAKAAGAFQDVCDALQSPGLSCEASLPALWASLPEATGDPRRNDRHAYALAVQPVADPMPFLRLTTAQALVGPLPDQFALVPNRVDYLRSFLAAYPGANGWQPPGDAAEVPAKQDANGRWYVQLQWPPTPSTTDADERAHDLFRSVAPQYGRSDIGWLRPKLANVHPVPNLMMTWWALLYGLSMLARYYPERWTEMLLVDKSPAAATLEAILDDALTVVPRLVLSSITRRPYFDQ